MDEFQTELGFRISDLLKTGLISEKDSRILNLLLGLNNKKQYSSQAAIAKLSNINLSETGINVRINSLLEKLCKSDAENYCDHLSVSAKGFVNLYDQLTIEKGHNLDFLEFQRELRTRINDRLETGVISDDDKDMLELILGLGSDKRWLSQCDVAELYPKIPKRTINERINSAIKKVVRSDINNYLDHLNNSAENLADIYNEIFEKTGKKLSLADFQKELQTRINDRFKTGIISSDDKKLLELYLGIGNRKKWLRQHEIVDTHELNLSEDQICKHLKSAVEVVKKSDTENYVDHLNRTSSCLADMYNQLSENAGKKLAIYEFQGKIQELMDIASKRSINPLTAKEKEALEMLLCMGKNQKYLNQAQIAEKMKVDSSTVNDFIAKGVKRLNCSDIKNYLEHLRRSAKPFADLYSQLTIEKGHNLDLDEFQKELRTRINDKYETNVISRDDKEMLELMLGLKNDKKRLSQSEAAKILKIKGTVTGINNRINNAIEKVNKTNIENYIEHLDKSAKRLKDLYYQLADNKGKNLTLNEFQEELKSRINNKRSAGIISESDKELLELVLGVGNSKKWLNQPDAAKLLTSKVGTSSSSIGRRMNIATEKLAN
jgi:predicted XRE-type DNA-binding protein